MAERSCLRQRRNVVPAPVICWASQCFAMRDELIALAQRQVLPQACGHPFHLLPVELAQQITGAGT
ncbi:hypothetical protein CGQ12_34250, partial [Pseudomonas aeruginosa]|uniref:DUF3158 family protein n=1 Tax=Pseudomonas aeruginosa TaxID=287 RepID=UPI000BCC4190